MTTKTLIKTLIPKIWCQLIKKDPHLKSYKQQTIWLKNNSQKIIKLTIKHLLNNNSNKVNNNPNHQAITKKINKIKIIKMHQILILIPK
jgi:hypothetical protein